MTEYATGREHWAPYGGSSAYAGQSHEVNSHSLVEISSSKSFERRKTDLHCMTVESISAMRSARVDYCYLGSQHLLVAWQDAVRDTGETIIDGLQRSTLRTLTHKLTFVPAGQPYRDWHESRTPTKAMFLYIHPDTQPFRHVAGKPLTSRLLFEDKTLWETAMKLRGAFDYHTGDAMPYFDAVASVLAHELARLIHSMSMNNGQLRGGLTGRQQRLLKTHIESHLTQRISIASLATLVDLSSSHFCRAFKESFGISPHRYQTRLRIERAKAILESTEPSITEIGMRLGFCDTSAFTKTFHKETGMKPTSYRRSLI